MNNHFEVKFDSSRGPLGGKSGAGNPLDFHGKGELIVSDESITLRGRARHFFYSGPQQEHQLPASTVWDVRQFHKRLAFDVNMPGISRMQKWAFTAKNREDAKQIFDLLPKQQTADFAVTQAEWRDFNERLLAFCPRVPVSLSFVTINVVIFLAMAFSGVGFFSADGTAAVAWGTNYGPLTLGGQWWRLVSAIFVHFGLVHIALNMSTLLMIGPLVERLYGSWRFLFLYLLAGVCGEINSLWWHADINGAGASGAIFALFGATVAFLLNRKNAVPRIVSKMMLKQMGTVVGLNLLIGFSIPFVDNAAHLGGLAAGLVLGFLLARPLPFLEK